MIGLVRTVTYLPSIVVAACGLAAFGLALWTEPDMDPARVFGVVLALSFLMMVGVLLIADGFGKHISKGYVYFAMAYALAVDLINIRRRRAHP